MNNQRNCQLGDYGERWTQVYRLFVAVPQSRDDSTVVQKCDIMALGVEREEEKAEEREKQVVESTGTEVKVCVSSDSEVPADKPQCNGLCESPIDGNMNTNSVAVTDCTGETSNSGTTDTVPQPAVDSDTGDVLTDNNAKETGTSETEEGGKTTEVGEASDYATVDEETGGFILHTRVSCLLMHMWTCVLGRNANRNAFGFSQESIISLVRIVIFAS